MQCCHNFLRDFRLDFFFSRIAVEKLFREILNFVVYLDYCITFRFGWSCYECKGLLERLCRILWPTVARDGTENGDNWISGVDGLNFSGLKDTRIKLKMENLESNFFKI